MRDTTADLLMAAARRLRRGYALAIAEYDVSPAQARALRVVARRGPVRLSVIADELRIAARSATEVIDALEDGGLVARQPDPDDRRATQVVVTDAGQTLVALLVTARAKASRELLGRLDPADRADLDRVLRLLAE